MSERENFTKDLAALINSHSLENVSDTPDWIIAEYLVKCLDNYHEIDTAKKKYFKKTVMADDSIIF